MAKGSRRSGFRHSCGTRHSYNQRKKDIRRQRAMVAEHGPVEAAKMTKVPENFTPQDAKRIADRLHLLKLNR